MKTLLTALLTTALLSPSISSAKLYPAELDYQMPAEVVLSDKPHDPDLTIWRTEISPIAGSLKEMNFGTYEVKPTGMACLESLTDIIIEAKSYYVRKLVEEFDKPLNMKATYKIVVKCKPVGDK